MHADPDRDFFLLTAIEWAALPGDAAALLSREAAYCHLLFQRGRNAAVLSHISDLCEQMLGWRPQAGRRSDPDAAQTLAAAADLFHRLQLAVVLPGGASCKSA